MRLILAIGLALASHSCSQTCEDPCPKGTSCVADRCRTSCTATSECDEHEVCFRGYCEVGDLRPSQHDGDGLPGDPPPGDSAGDPIAGDPTAGDPTSGDPTTGDPTAGDPISGDPTTGDSGPPRCGNGVIDTAIGEKCDGSNFGTRVDCVSFNWGSGPITCMATCKEFDLSACLNPPGQCGNGTVIGQQQCDTDDFNDETCETLGFSGGMLECNANCSFDVTGCSL